VLIRTLPGATAGGLIHTFNEVGLLAENLRNSQYETPVGRRESYLEWVDVAVSRLRHLLPPEELDRLVTTPAFWHIQAAAAPLANGMTRTINREIDARRDVFDKLLGELNRPVERWSSLHVVVPDASMFFRHDKLEDWNLAPLIGVEGELGIHIVIPMAVIDELDRLKESGNQFARWRAKYSLAVLDRILPDPTDFGLLRDTGFEPGRGFINAELLIDPPGHVRLPEADDEIIDQAVTVNALAPEPITFLTYDTGQATRARARGLACRKLPDPPEGAEPARSR
jgi:hypothetical protein